MNKSPEIDPSNSAESAPFRCAACVLPASELGGFPMKRAVLYLRVSTIEQTTTNQEREQREIAGPHGL
jgi:hypothetical protein